MDSKRGSHVGFVISFVIFITFLVFMYFLLNSRIDFGQEKKNSLEYLKGELTQRFLGDLTSSSVAVNSPGSDCVELSNFLSLTGMGDRVVARSDSGNVLNTGVSGSNLQIQRSGNTFFRIYGSGEFSQETDSLTGCESLSEGQYTIGFTRDSEEVFESKIIDFLENYTTDYETLKKDIRINSKDEFGFRFVYNNGTETKTPEKNLTTNIYIDRIPVQYVKTNAAIESGFIDAIIW